MTTGTYVMALVGALLCGVGLGIALCSPTIERLRGDVEVHRRRWIAADDSLMAERSCRRREDA